MSDNQLTVIAPSIVPSASPDTAQVCAALAAAQGKFTNPKRTKTATVTPRDGGRGYTFAYAPLEEVVAAIKDGLAENGLSRQQHLLRDSSGQWVLRTVLWHASGQWISGDYPVIYSKDNAQGFAGGVTYAKRNGLSLLLGLAAEDDDDGNVADANAAVIAGRSDGTMGVAERPVRKPNPPAPNPMNQAQDKQFEDIHRGMMEAAAKGGGALEKERERIDRDLWPNLAEVTRKRLQEAYKDKYQVIAWEVDDQAQRVASRR